MADANAIAQALGAVLGPMLANLAPAAPPAAQFARSPAQARNDLLDYTKPGDAKIYKAATEPLPTVFSLDKPNIRILLNELTTRAESSAWSIHEFNVPGIGNVNLLKDYGRVTLEQCLTHVNTYINANQRAAQDDYQLFLCLNNSGDTKTKETMEHLSSDFTAGVAPNTVVSGLLYLKKLLSESTIDTRATSSHVRDNLGNLDKYMVTKANHNVEAFNAFVKEQLAILTARGETSTDLVTNIFKGYAKTDCKEFRDYIKKRKENWEDSLEDFTPETLMKAAAQKYKALCLLGEWRKKSEEEELITALRAQIKQSCAPKQRTPKFLPSDKPNQQSQTTGNWE